MSTTPSTICKRAANGNPDAERFCLAWVRFCHLIDDLVDQDKARDDEDITGILIQFICELSCNAFYQQHRALLLGLIVQSSNSWLDSNIRTGVERDVLKGMWHEVVYHVAFLTGGWQHLRTLTQECRYYDFENDSQEDKH